MVNQATHKLYLVASAYINLGVVLAETGRLDQGVEIWKRGLEEWARYVWVGEIMTVVNNPPPSYPH